MKKTIIVLILMVISVSAFPHFGASILTREDEILAEESTAYGPALSSASNAKDQWGSYNQWMCFPKMDVKYECAQYDQDILVPSVKAQTNEHVFFFELHVEDGVLCEKTLAEWEKMSIQSSEVCLFAAQMPNTDLGEDRGRPQSLWYLDALKTENGYWQIAADSVDLPDNL